MCQRIVCAYTSLLNSSVNIPSLTSLAHEKVCACTEDGSTVEESNAFRFFCQAMYRNHFWLHGTVLDHLSHRSLSSEKSSNIIVRAHICPCNHSDMFWCRNLVQGNKQARRTQMKGCHKGRSANTPNDIRRKQVIYHLRNTRHDCTGVFESQAHFIKHLEEHSMFCRYHKYLLILLQLIKSQMAASPQRTRKGLTSDGRSSRDSKGISPTSF